MKKIILLLAATASIALVSCGNADKAGSEADSAATDSTAAEAAVADTISAEDFQTQLDELVAAKDTAGITALLKKSQATISSYAGNSDAVKQYVEKVQKAIDKNAKAINVIYPSFTEIAKKAVALPSEVAETAEKAGKQLVDSAKSATKRKVESDVNAAKTKTAEAVSAAENEAKKKANEKIENAQKKANDAVNKAASDVAKKLKLN